jgi:hypothetical protein
MSISYEAAGRKEKKFKNNPSVECWIFDPSWGVKLDFGANKKSPLRRGDITPPEGWYGFRCRVRPGGQPPAWDPGSVILGPHATWLNEYHLIPPQ